jgi:hypothetical protein
MLGDQGYKRRWNEKEQWYRDSCNRTMQSGHRGRERLNE